MFKKLRKSAFFSSFFLPMDPDLDSESRSTKSLNPDPIRIHNPDYLNGKNIQRRPRKYQNSKHG
jgi:hypothetical protein